MAVEELDRALAGTDDLRGHPVETAAAAAATARAAKAATAAAAKTAAAAAEAAAVTAAKTAPVAAEAATITAAETATVAAEIAASAEGIEAVFTEPVALVPAPTFPSIVTHNLKRTFVFSPPFITFPYARTERAGTGREGRIRPPPP
ncbi:hypothetical protein N0B51_01585 [Tsuneonella sp. YG55]|uniref:Uncharacterized protein n=1 Tax=Tsuneonella litorea TaxID=2976475 RepID=A0A9X2VZY5_9SPHN|nr:hypothetical protein [Tsuneonella litorea]